MYISPGQRAVQVIFCTDIPSQKAPPLRGAGLVQVRERFCHPLPQRTLQADHSVQEDQPPFTERQKWEGRKKGERFVLIAYYVQATVPGAVSQGFGEEEMVPSPSHLLLCCEPAVVLILLPFCKRNLESCLCRELLKTGTTHHQISKVLDNPEYKKKISASEFLLLLSASKIIPRAPLLWQEMS